jgi:predicted permease
MPSQNSFWNKLTHSIRALFRRTKVETELDSELRFHIESQIETNIRAGMSPEAARQSAVREFGAMELAKEECRDERGTQFFEQLWQDVRFGARMLRKNPGFTAIAVLSLALGIGANTAIFQLIDALMLRDLPISDPHSLVEIQIAGGNGGMGINSGAYPQLTLPIWNELQKHREPFSEMFAWGADGINIGRGRDTRWSKALWVSGDFFRALGVQPWRGRMIQSKDEGQCPESRAVVSYSYWREQMGSRELGSNSTLFIDGKFVDVVGVAPPEFFGLIVGDSFDVALPICQSKEELLRRDEFDVAVMARLRPGWTLRKASAELDAISPGLFTATAPTEMNAGTIETYKRFRLAALPASKGVTSLRKEYGGALFLLLGITGLVLMIACTNVANLTLARASVREQEMAMRQALGASRGRLMRQLIVESGLLAGAGTALAVFLARMLSEILLRSLSTGDNSILLNIAPDWRVFLFAAAAAALTSVVFGAAPAMRATRVEPASAMKASGRGLTSARGQFSLQRMMVVAEVAFSLVLMAGALLFVGSFRKLIAFDPGMREAGITVAMVAVPQQDTSPSRFAQIQRQLLDEVRSSPGILDAATTTNTPLTGGSWEHDIQIGAVRGTSKFAWVSPQYFRTMGIPLIAGRDFVQADTDKSERVAVVNQTFVRRFLNGANPIGQVLRTYAEPGFPATPYQIVGVIRDTQYDSVRDETPPMTFAPASQYPAPGQMTTMLIYSNQDPANVIAAVKRVAEQKYPEAVTVGGALQTWIRNGFVRDRMMAMLAGFFGVLAVLLTIAGLYGVFSYSVSQRRKEIGIRIALGAQRVNIMGMILREASALLLIGVAIGLSATFVLGRTANTLLFHLKATDPLTLAVVVVAMATVSIAACWIPARRAMRVDPMTALRNE